MDVSQMRMMLALAERKSMTATAKKLNVTQPALTYQLNAIEAELGFKVFNRTRTGTSLTPEGEFLMGAVGKFVADYEEALRHARQMSAPQVKALSGSAVIGTVVGDIHDIGKNLVRIAMEASDIRVADLGTEASAEDFVGHVRANPDCKLALISVNRTELRDEARGVIQALRDAGLREGLFIMVGGSATDEAFAQDAGADAYTASAEDAADRALEFLSGHGEANVHDAN